MNKFLLSAAVLLTAGAVYALDIVKNGVPQAEIVVAEDAHNGIKLAAKDLQTYIEKMSGAKLAVVNAPTGKVKNRLFVGENEFTRKLGYKLPKFSNSGLDILVKDDYAVLSGPSTFYNQTPRYSKKNLQEFWDYMGEKVDPNYFQTSRQVNRPLGICVDDDIGAWHAVSEFLEQLGIRFYAPYENGTVIPQKKDIVFKSGRITKEAAYGLREYTYYKAMWTDADGVSWLKRTKCGTCRSFVYGHSTKTLIHYPEIRRKHPNWFAEENPGRLYPGSGHSGGIPRYTDPEFQQACINWANKLLDINPTLYAVTLGSPDGGNPWDWRDRKKYTKPGMKDAQAYANMLWDFHAAVAKGIKAKHPDKFLIWWCQYNPSIPSNINPDDIPDNIVAPAQPLGPHHLVMPSEYNKNLQSLIGTNKAFRCREKGPAWEWWLFYRTPSAPRYPIFFPRTLQKWRKEVRKLTLGTFMELSPAWQASGIRHHAGQKIAEVPLVHLMLYINNKLFWDPDLDLNALLEEYYRLWFGPAAKEMKAFYDFAEAVWSRDESRSVTENSGFLKEKDIGRYFELLAQARAKTQPGTIYFKRIEALEKGYASLKKLFPSLKRTGPFVRAYTVPNDTKVDGNLGKYKLGWFSLCDIRSGEEPRRNATQAVISLSNDRSKIFAGIRCYESSMEKLARKCRINDDQSIFEDDLVELYLDTPEHSYFKICVNPNGAVYDETTDITLINRDSMGIMWNPGTRAVVKHYPDRWEVEMMIPTADFGKLGPSKQYPWGLNIGRTRISSLGVNSQKAYCITPMNGGYRNLKCWAKMWIR